MQADQQDALAGGEKCYGDANVRFTIEGEMPGLPFQVGACLALSRLHRKAAEVLNLQSIAGRNGGDLLERRVLGCQMFEAMAKGGKVEGAPEPHGLRDGMEGRYGVWSVQGVKCPEGKCRSGTMKVKNMSHSSRRITFLSRYFGTNCNFLLIQGHSIGAGGGLKLRIICLRINGLAAGDPAIGYQSIDKCCTLGVFLLT